MGNQGGICVAFLSGCVWCVVNSNSSVVIIEGLPFNATSYRGNREYPAHRYLC